LATAKNTITVNKATPTITWNTPASISVGTVLSSTQLNATASVAGAFVYSPAAGTVMNTAGSQTISATFTPTDAANYSSATGSVTLAVNGGSLNTPTITWSAPAAIAYGTALSSTQLDATANYPGTFAYSPASGAILGAGTQKLTVTFTPSDPTTIASAAAKNTITVNKATPTITWNTPASISVGTALSSTQLNATASVAGAFVYSPAAGTVMNTAGSQTISATLTPTDAADYNSATRSVTLVVNAGSLATPAITWSAPAAIAYGTALSSTQLDATANYPGTFAYSPVSGAILDAGTQKLTATFTPSDPTTVASTTATNTVTVNKAMPTITWNTPSSISVGTTLSSTQLNATASVAGTFVYYPAAGTVMNTAGAQALAVTLTPTDAANYYSATATVSLNVNAAAGAPSYSWTNVRVVGGGYIPGVYFHPAQQNLVYARTDVGGAYRWGPSDTQWVPLLDFTPMANWDWAGVEALGLDPTNPTKLYLAVGQYYASWAGNGAMLVSNDQGQTFTTVPLDFENGSNEPGRATGDRIAVDPNLPSTVYFGTRLAGLQISTDSGSTWTKVSGLPVTTTSNQDGVVAVLPLKSSGPSGAASPAVYAAVGGTGTGTDPVGMYVTANGGSTTSTWVPLTGQPSFSSASTPLAPLQAKLGPDGSIYVLYGDQPGPNTMTVGQLWKFVPGSNWTSGTWTQITLPNKNLTINDSNGYGAIAVDPSNAGYLLLSTLDQYWPTADVVYRSTDDGATWRDVSSVKVDSYSLSPDLATHDASLAPYVAFHQPASEISTGNWTTTLAIDPFNPDHAMYGNGGQVWATTDLTNADPSDSSLGIVNWTIGSLGIEETAIKGLWAPPSGNTILLSSMGDNYGFAHQDLTVSPPQQMYSNPAATPTSMDFVQNTPTTVVRVTDGSGGASPIGVVSTDGGLTWTGFVSAPSGSKGGGQIAIAPDGSSIVWATEDTSSVWYSTNGGTTWIASTGISPQAQVVSDRAAAGVYYGFSNGALTMSTNGGATFTTLQTGIPSGSYAWPPVLVSVPDAQGDVWLTGGDEYGNLYSNTGSSTSPRLTAVSGVQWSYFIGYGKAVAGSNNLTLYLDGTIGGAWGLYRSTDRGSTWLQINDPAHQWAGFTAVCGDMRTFGTVYLGTNGGRGIIWGTSAN
jgi:hypothetical protein